MIVDNLMNLELLFWEAAAAGNAAGPCLTTPPHLPPWAICRLRPLPCTPEQSLSLSEARRGLRSPAQAAPKLKIPHFQPPGNGTLRAMALSHARRTAALWVRPDGSTAG